MDISWSNADPKEKYSFGDDDFRKLNLSNEVFEKRLISEYPQRKNRQVSSRFFFLDKLILNIYT